MQVVPKININKLSGLFFLLLLYIIWQTAPPGAAAAGTVIVKGEHVLVREGPGTSYVIVGEVTKDEKLNVLEKSGDWYKVQLSNGSGWVAGWLLTTEQTSSITDKVAVVMDSGINIRSGPGTGHDVVGQVNKGERLPVLQKTGDWYQVQLANGSGWIAGWLVQVEQGNQVPQIPAEPQEPEKPETPQTPQQPQVPDKEPTTGGNSGQVSKPDSSTQKAVPTMPEWLRPREDNQKESPQKPEEKPEDWKGGTLKDIDVDVQDNKDKVSITLKATDKFKLNVFTLGNPERLVLDLTGIAPGKVSETINVRSAMISQVRTGWFSRDPVTTRVVVDLKQWLRYSTSLSSDEKTLTVELSIPKLGEELVNRVIVIDAGHGGRDPGAIGASGLYEKDVTIDIAEQVVDLLEANGAKVTMSRLDDTYVGLDERTEVANRLRADLFVSIHINASTSRDLAGTSTYYRDERGKELSRFIQSQLVFQLGRRDMGIRYANFAVLRTSEMPSALAEVAFISNPEEERLLKTEEFRRKAAQAIAQGISDYYISQ